MRLLSELSVIWSSIPSPGSWGRQYRLYGIMIALGVVLGLELARRRWADRGGNPEDMSSIALWGVPAGLIGARLYHVVTDNQLYQGHWFDIPWAPGANSPLAVWQGGLGIPGGIAAGVSAGVYAAHRKGIRLGPALDVAAPCLALAQAIGRWGNYFNIELFGSPTSLPWGLEVPFERRPAGYLEATTFHPTFLYESLWNVGLVLVLIWIDKLRVLRPGRIFPLYIGGYFLGRLWVEALRIDDANRIFGLRVNTWMSLIAIAGVAIFLIVGGVRRRPEDSDEPYVDGHRFDPAAATLEAEQSSATDTLGRDDLGETTSAAVSVSATSGTKARAARRDRDGSTPSASASAAPPTSPTSPPKSPPPTTGDKISRPDQPASGGGADDAAPEP